MLGTSTEKHKLKWKEYCATLTQAYNAPLYENSGQIPFLAIFGGVVIIIYIQSEVNFRLKQFLIISLSLSHRVLNYEDYSHEIPHVGTSCQNNVCNISKTTASA